MNASPTHPGPPSLLQHFLVGARTRANYRNHTTPCVLHFSGVHKGLMSTVARGAAADAWILDMDTGISRNIHKAGDLLAAWRRTQRVGPKRVRVVVYREIVILRN